MFETPNGTKLPILKLKGKDYLQVQWRIVWFREEHPTWGIETHLTNGDKFTIAQAIIKDDSGRIIAMAHKREDQQGFGDYTEKAETGAIGRALALIGYGTQFTNDLDEGERIVDSPSTTKDESTPFDNVPPPVGTHAKLESIINTTKTTFDMGKELGEVRESYPQHPLANYTIKHIRDIAGRRLVDVDAQQLKDQRMSLIRWAAKDPSRNLNKWKEDFAAIETYLGIK